MKALEITGGTICQHSLPVIEARAFGFTTKEITIVLADEEVRAVDGVGAG